MCFLFRIFHTLALHFLNILIISDEQYRIGILNIVLVNDTKRFELYKKGNIENMNWSCTSIGFYGSVEGSEIGVIKGINNEREESNRKLR